MIFANLLINKSNISMKRSKKFTKLEAEKVFDSQLTMTDQKIFTQLETGITQNEKPAKLTSGCSCKICVECLQPPIVQQDHFGSSPDAYQKIFMLLQQLTLLQPGLANKILQNINIPTFFFHRQEVIPLKGPSSQRRLSRNRSNQSNEAAQKLSSFIMFESDQKTGRLLKPQIIHSIEKVRSFLEQKCEKIRKGKQKQDLEKIKKFNKQFESQVIIREQNMQEEIPSFFLSSTLNNSLRENQIRAKSYIIHSKEKFIQTYSDTTRRQTTEPFCIFRYKCEEWNGQISPYEIFTSKKLEMFIKNKQKSFAVQKQHQNLEISCIESYTKTKINPVFPKTILDGIFCSLNLLKADVLRKIPVLYYVDYCENDHKKQQNEIFKLAKLQVLLKANKISKIDPIYIDEFELEGRIKDCIGVNSPTSQNQFKNLALYRSYKIVCFLKYICNIAILQIQLKWLMSESNQLFLIECSEYRIDVARSLMHKQNKGLYQIRIIKNGLSMLNERYQQYQTSGNQISTTSSSMPIDMAYLKERKQKVKTEQSSTNFTGTKNSTNYKMSIKSISKSMNLSEHWQGYKKLPEIFNKKKMAEKHLSIKQFASMKNTGVTNSDPYMNPQLADPSSNLNSKFPLLCENFKIQNHNQNARKLNKFRLRPFKTEASEIKRRFKSEETEI